MKLKSTAFHQGKAIPEQYTCLGKNISPPLQIENIPAGAKSLVLIIEDTDATPTPWTHWMVFNIPADTREIKENTIPEGAVEGLANNHSFGYEGPCPKYFTGTHHYWFRLYALDKLLDLPAASEREQVQESMQNSILAQADLLGICISPV